MTVKCEYCRTGGYGDLIEETPYWMIFLAPSQRFIGTCVVALKRQCQSLSELEDSEWDDFKFLVRKLETSLNETFHPDLYNWSCFKNAAFRDDDPTPEIHWHFIPRYQSEIKFGGLIFDDPDFGYIPQPIPRIIPADVMEKIKLEIKRNYINRE
jgi:diadenosine tetraphosphate (Ap4A) HIT family hydrolase